MVQRLQIRGQTMQSTQLQIHPYPKALHFLYSLIATCILMLCVSIPCSAKTTDELEVDWLSDGVFTGASGAMWITFELLKSEIAPRECIWCQTNVMDDSITDALAWQTPKYAANTADATAFGVIPAFVTASLLLSSGLDGRIENAGTDMMLIAESLTLSSLLNQVVKFSVGRARPFTVRGHEAFYPDRSDDNLSFYSGHTNMAFALVVSAGTIAHIRNYDAEPYIWGIGIPLALFVGYTRIAAEKHYFSDVLIGALIGSTVGFLVPWLHRNDDSHSTGSTPVSGLNIMMGSQMLTISGQF